MFLSCLVFSMFCARLFICALWSPAGKGLTSWLSFVVFTLKDFKNAKIEIHKIYNLLMYQCY